MSTLLVWLDIPVKNLDRALAFYQAVLHCEAIDHRPSHPSATLQSSNLGAGLTLIESPNAVQPGTARPYFNCSGRLSEAVARVGLNGGKVIEPAHSMEPFGFRSLIEDPDGHALALHSESL